MEQTKIINIDQFTLEKIFMYLDFDDLIKMADTNKYLRIATYHPIAHKYSGKMIRIDSFYSSFKNCVWKDEVLVAKLKIGFQLLRCFGHMINELVLFNPRIENFRLCE